MIMIAAAFFFASVAYQKVRELFAGSQSRRQWSVVRGQKTSNVIIVSAIS